MPEFDIKINYPATWTMTDNDLVDANTKVVFYSPREGPSDTYLDSFTGSDSRTVDDEFTILY